MEEQGQKQRTGRNPVVKACGFQATGFMCHKRKSHQVFEFRFGRVTSRETSAGVVPGSKRTHKGWGREFSTAGVGGGLCSCSFG